MSTAYGQAESTPTAGWYPDPHVAGAHRWWDGARWTEHTQQEPALAPASAQGAAAQAFPQQGGYQSHATAGYQSHSASGFQPQAASGSQPHGNAGFQPHGTSGFQPHGTSGFQPQTASGYQPQAASGYQPQAASGFQPQGTSGFQPQGTSGFDAQGTGGSQPAGSGGYQPHHQSTFQGYGSAGVGAVPGYPSITGSAPAYPSQLGGAVAGQPGFGAAPAYGGPSAYPTWSGTAVPLEAPKNGLATGALVAGIVVLVVLVFTSYAVASALAIIIGVRALRKANQIKAEGYPKAVGRGRAITGLVLSGIGAAFYLLALVAG